MVCVEFITEIGVMIIPTEKEILLVRPILSKVGGKLGKCLFVCLFDGV
jgi:hypothetical protein